MLYWMLSIVTTLWALVHTMTGEITNQIIPIIGAIIITYLITFVAFANFSEIMVDVLNPIIRRLPVPVWITDWRSETFRILPAVSQNQHLLSRRQEQLYSLIQQVERLIVAWNPASLAHPLASFDQRAQEILGVLDGISPHQERVKEDLTTLHKLVKTFADAMSGTIMPTVVQEVQDLGRKWEQRMDRFEEDQVTRILEVNQQVGQLNHKIYDSGILVSDFHKIYERLEAMDYHLGRMETMISIPQGRPVSAPPGPFTTPVSPTVPAPARLYNTSLPTLYQPGKLPTDDDINLQLQTWTVASYAGIDYDYFQAGSPHAPRFVGVSPTTGQLCYASSKKDLGKLITVAETQPTTRDLL